MTFCPEWVTGSPNLDTSNPLYLWVYLVVSFCCYFTVPCRGSTRRLTVHEHNVSIVCFRIPQNATHVAITSWVVVPVLLMIDSYGHIAGTLRAAKAANAKSKRA